MIITILLLLWVNLFHELEILFVLETYIHRLHQFTLTLLRL